jgi:hypothetical protein
MITTLNKRILTLSKLKGIGAARLQQLVDTPNFANVSVSALATLHLALDKALRLPKAWDDALIAAEQDIAAAESAGAPASSVLTTTTTLRYSAMRQNGRSYCM